MTTIPIPTHDWDPDDLEQDFDSPEGSDAGDPRRTLGDAFAAMRDHADAWSEHHGSQLAPLGWLGLTDGGAWLATRLSAPRDRLIAAAVEIVLAELLVYRQNIWPGLRRVALRARRRDTSVVESPRKRRHAQAAIMAAAAWLTLACGITLTGPHGIVQILLFAGFFLVAAPHYWDVHRAALADTPRAPSRSAPERSSSADESDLSINATPRTPGRPAGHPVPASDAHSQSPAPGQPNSATPGSQKRPYVLPPLTSLNVGGQSASATPENREVADAITQTFANHRIRARAQDMLVGPRLTTYVLDTAPDCKVSAITQRHADLAVAAKAPHPKAVAILAPIPGRNAIGIQVPNATPTLVTLRDVLTSPEATRNRSPLLVGLGADAFGAIVTADIAKLVHTLIGGATCTGKSTVLNDIIVSLLTRTRPSDVRLLLIDLKRVEFEPYEGVPHLLCPIITEPSTAAAALRWLVQEMQDRYDTLLACRCRNIAEYNAKVAAGFVDPRTGDPAQQMPYIPAIVDELADLMMRGMTERSRNDTDDEEAPTVRELVEQAIVRLSQLARGVGIHLILATQRPSVDVVTGLIKANIPSRIALTTASHTDSGVIIDRAGAENLLGNGDALYKPMGVLTPIRLQSAYVTRDEIDKVVEACIAAAGPDTPPPDRSLQRALAAA